MLLHLNEFDSTNAVEKLRPGKVHSPAAGGSRVVGEGGKASVALC